MTFVEIILLSVSLCVDTLAVSVCGGVTLGDAKAAKAVRIALTFGFMQAVMLFAGWILGHSIVSYIDSYSGIVAFALLLYIGVMMIFNAVRKKDETPARLSDFKSLFLASVATSIDASAVGVSLAMLEMPFARIYMTVGSVFIVTIFAALCGILCGRYIGQKFGKPAYIAGGTVLILIGLHILLS